MPMFDLKHPQMLSKLNKTPVSPQDLIVVKRLLPGSVLMPSHFSISFLRGLLVLSLKIRHCTGTLTVKTNGFLYKTPGPKDTEVRSILKIIQQPSKPPHSFQVSKHCCQ